MAEVPVWTERLRVCSYDVDFTRRATSVSLCRYFLEAAWNHAEALGVGFSHLQQQGRYWVLSRLVLGCRAPRSGAARQHSGPGRAEPNPRSRCGTSR